MSSGNGNGSPVAGFGWLLMLLGVVGATIALSVGNMVAFVIALGIVGVGGALIQLGGRH